MFLFWHLPSFSVWYILRGHMWWSISSLFKRSCHDTESQWHCNFYLYRKYVVVGWWCVVEHPLWGFHHTKESKWMETNTSIYVHKHKHEIRRCIQILFLTHSLSPTQTCMSAWVCIYVHIWIYAGMYIHEHIYMPKYMYIYMHEYMHICICTYIYIYIWTYIYKHMYI